jgi:uncharacterized damage-inducible protein DinB
MALIDGLLQELDAETPATRRVLERVPDDRLNWRPHPKSRTLGVLAFHIAHLPAALAELALPSEVQAFEFVDPIPRSTSEIVSTLDESVAKAKRVLAGIDDATILARWRLKAGEQVLIEMPRIVLLRSTLLNHWYHHRGQLTVYLRELDVPVPAIYGPSADELPQFVQASAA